MKHELSLHKHTHLDLQLVHTCTCTEDLLLLNIATTKVKNVKLIATITELVVVCSVCSTCTCAVNQRFLWPQLLMQWFTLLPQMLQRLVKTTVPSLSDEHHAL